METVLITIETGNSAFDPDPRPETVRILRELADHIEKEPDPFARNPRGLIDTNGGVAGQVEVW